jgi:hypothetical protein
MYKLLECHELEHSGCTATDTAPAQNVIISNPDVLALLSPRAPSDSPLDILIFLPINYSMDYSRGMSTL